jgi:hypothetical protein
MFSTLAQVCQYELNLLSKKRRGELNKVGKTLRDQNISPAEVAAFGRWWYANDWRGKRGDPPNPAQILDTWGRFKNYQDPKEGNQNGINQQYSSGAGHRFATAADFGLVPLQDEEC